MRLLLVLICLLPCALHAEEVVDFHTPIFGAGGVSVTGRDATAAYYNPAFAAARPWERTQLDLLTIEFHLPVTFSAGIHGDDFRSMFDVVDAANDLFESFQGGSFNTPSSATLDDFDRMFDIFNKLDILESLSGDGIYATSSAGFGVRLGNLFMAGDGLSITAGGFAMAGVATIVDLDSLRNFRFVDESGIEWDTMVLTAAVLSGQGGKAPSTPGGQQFSLDLQAAGYPANEADILAGTAEDSGINFGGAGSSILFDFLVNTRNGTGESLESGANPLEGNGSGFVIRGLAFYELGISYGMPLPIPVIGDWLAVGATVRFIQAYTFSRLLLVQDMDENGIKDTLDSLQKQTRDAYTLRGDAARFNVGIDLGVVFTPQVIGLNGLAVSLTGRNLNGPEFRWEPATGVEPRLIRFDAQFRMGAAYTLFHGINLPLTVAIESDLNRVSSDILPRYHTQFARAAVTFEPQWGIFGFGLRLGAFKNIADAEQAVTLTAGVGLRLWVVHLDVAGQLGLDTQDFGTTSEAEPIPQRLGVSVQLGVRIQF